MRELAVARRQLAEKVEPEVALSFGPGAVKAETVSATSFVRAIEESLPDPLLCSALRGRKTLAEGLIDELGQREGLGDHAAT